MVLRALTSLKADLSKSSAPGEEKGAIRAAEDALKSAPGPLTRPVEGEEERQPPKRGRPKKGGSLDSWPEAGDEDEVETFNLGKKS